MFDGLILIKLVVGDGAKGIPFSSFFSFSALPFEFILDGLSASRSAGSWHHRNPSKISGSEMKLGSLLMGPDGKHMCTPSGRWRPSDNVKGVLTIRCIDTISVFISRRQHILTKKQETKRLRTFTRRTPTLRLTQETIHTFLSIE